MPEPEKLIVTVKCEDNEVSKCIKAVIMKIQSDINPQITSITNIIREP